MLTTSSAKARPARRRRGRPPILLAVAIGLAFVLAACSAGAPPSGASGAPGGSAGSSPGGSAPASSPPAAGIVDSVAAAAAAVGAFDSNFLGYAPRDPDLIGQSAWFEGEPAGGGYEITFFRGSGDCPAGCIEQFFIKFFVGLDGRVEKRCEWRTGAAAAGTPC